METISHSDFRLFTCQAVLFTPDEEVSAKKILRGLAQQSSWATQFNGEPISLPPLSTVVSVGQQGVGLREVPKLIFQSEEPAVWHCEISSARINLHWTKKVKETPEINLTEFFHEAVTLLMEYKESANSRVGRIAAIVKRYAVNPTPGLFIAEHFCKEQILAGPVKNPAEFEVHGHKRYVFLDKYSVNSWVRSKSGALTFGQEMTPIVFVEQDFNTLAEEISEKDFEVKEITEFFDAVPGELDAIMKLYYPGDA